MNDYSRRKFLTRASLGGVAALAAAGGLSLPPILAAIAEAPEAAPVAPDLTAVGEDLVAFVRNASAGDLTVMSGSREVIYHDPQLVGRLLAAARQLASKE